MQRMLIRTTVHLLLAGLWLAVSWAVLIWPQMVALDGLNSSLALHSERLAAVADRHDVLSAANAHLAAWKRDRRRALQEEELDGYLRQAREVAKAAGARVLHLDVSDDTSGRWASLGSLSSEDQVETESDAPSYAVAVKSVRVALAGPFPAVYRTAERFTAAKPLSVLNHWQMRSSGDEVRAYLVTTLFVLRRTRAAGEMPGGSDAGAGRLTVHPRSQGEG